MKIRINCIKILIFETLEEQCSFYREFIFMCRNPECGIVFSSLQKIFFFFFLKQLSFLWENWQLSSLLNSQPKITVLTSLFSAKETKDACFYSRFFTVPLVHLNSLLESLMYEFIKMGWRISICMTKQIHHDKISLAGAGEGGQAKK